jgi:hypothetical protein
LSFNQWVLGSLPSGTTSIFLLQLNRPFTKSFYLRTWTFLSGWIKRHYQNYSMIAILHDYEIKDPQIDNSSPSTLLMKNGLSCQRTILRCLERLLARQTPTQPTKSCSERSVFSSLFSPSRGVVLMIAFMESGFSSKIGG